MKFVYGKKMTRKNIETVFTALDTQFGCMNWNGVVCTDRIIAIDTTDVQNVTSYDINGLFPTFVKGTLTEQQNSVLDMMRGTIRRYLITNEFEVVNTPEVIFTLYGQLMEASHPRRQFGCVPIRSLR